MLPNLKIAPVPVCSQKRDDLTLLPPCPTTRMGQVVLCGIKVRPGGQPQSSPCDPSMSLSLPETPLDGVPASFPGTKAVNLLPIEVELLKPVPSEKA